MPSSRKAAAPAAHEVSGEKAAATTIEDAQPASRHRSVGRLLVWLSAHRYDVLRDLVIGLALLGLTLLFENHLAQSQERLENVRFVRQTVMDGQVVKPFEGLDLRHANLAGLPMQCLSFGANDFTTGCSDFTGADLAGADLSRSNLKGVWLTRADLSGSNLRGADLEQAHLNGANLTGADMTGANITSTDFSLSSWNEAVIERVCRKRGYDQGPQSKSDPKACEAIALREENEIDLRRNR
jgi:Pentapeptide repeats (8 copies)